MVEESEEGGTTMHLNCSLTLLGCEFNGTRAAVVLASLGGTLKDELVRLS